MIDRLSQPKILVKKSDNKENNTSFKGAGTGVLTGLRGLSNSPAIGACAVDFCSMVSPRTIIETKNRGPQSGIETFFREASSCIIHACVGLIGLGAATLISGKFNNNYGVKAQNIFASGDTIKNMASLWNGANGDSKQFFDNFVQNIKGLNGNNWNNVSSEASQGIVENLIKLADKTKELSKTTGSGKKLVAQEVKDLKNLVVSQITKDTGASASYKLKADGAGKAISSSLSELVDNAVGLSNSFKSQTQEQLPSFINSLIKNKTASTMLGLGICAALCVSIQPLNRYLTKKRTGKDGFVGAEGAKADNSKGFKTAKTALGIAFPAFAISTIGKPADLLSNVQFNSKIPTINQFKFLYGLTIGSRFMSARDKNELRESTIKDTLGFTNWLILGGMVSKLTARALGGSDLINNPITAENGKKGIKYAAKWLTQASVKSYDEVLLPAAKEISKDGKVLKFSEMLKNADGAVKSKVFKIAASQVAGYLYSGLVLGVGISKLNIFITKKLSSKNHIQKTPNVEKGYGIDYFNNIKSELNTVFNDFN